ncbi:phosphonate C-P lyase system protein PhnH [Ktedonosporobacter rubrisoli]|uniref:phosphonate C-P lyase system protein PhnH n=1 Tax=Ktedonosporobacter rubrisoli TaxID=2509675 RepID=UPI0013EE8AFD|nr:phosphonate C-P lyase system protein PhnH [Ktedonosporobacter rubrisoli]
MSVQVAAWHDRQQRYIHYSTGVFRQLLDCLARPGKLNRLEDPIFLDDLPTYYSARRQAQVPFNRYALGALMTLLDGEVSFTLAADGHWLSESDAAVYWLALRTGSHSAAASEATFALFCDGKSGGLLRELSLGTLLEPELSATAIYCVERLADEREQLSGPEVISCALRGPGIPDLRRLQISGLEAHELELIKATRGVQQSSIQEQSSEPLALEIGQDNEQARTLSADEASDKKESDSSGDFALGVDVYLIDATGLCVGLPRTTRLVKG